LIIDGEIQIRMPSRLKFMFPVTVENVSSNEIYASCFQQNEALIAIWR
jgi:hypothetical protein